MQQKENQSTIFPPATETPRRNFTERHATAVKAVAVAVLTLFLLIPLEMVKSLIRERQSSKAEAVADITSKWGSRQIVAGPCLVLPYTETVVEDKKQVQVRRNLLVLPETLDVNGSVAVEKRRRGIYDASVYGADVTLAGTFVMSPLAKFGVLPSQIEWDNAQVIIGLTDLKGIKEKVTLDLGGRQIGFESGIPVNQLAKGSAYTKTVSLSDTHYYDGETVELFSAGLNAKIDSLSQGSISFSVSLKMNGSQGFYLIPTGRTTMAKLQSDWVTPKFDGEFLPENHDVRNDGFTAQWQVLDLNRSFGQIIRTEDANSMNQMAASAFGVQFIQAVDQYQQNMRSVKYAILIVLLTFVVVFFIELIKKKSVNPLQYLLVGLALVLFYSLLLSMSEVWGFNLAYAVSAAMTTLLITLHMGAILKNRRQGLLIGALLLFIYVFIFILIQMESYALLVGSLGLFAILAVIMYYSKKVKF